MEKATVAAGCFWGIEEDFRKTKGVCAAMVGYTGGHFKNPTYEDVCSGQTGHAEAVEIEFDPNVITYGKLLEVFWAIHDPTTLDRQGPDVGSQYRSAIFYHTPQQKQIAEQSKEKLRASGRFQNEVVTQIVSASDFFKAEEYHQCYLTKMREQ